MCSWSEGLYNQVIEPEPEPSWNAGVNGSQRTSPSEINCGMAGCWPPSLLSYSLLLLPGTAAHPFTSAASADLGAATGPFGLKCPDVAPLGAATGRWGALEQGLECASEGMATGNMSAKCWLRSLQRGRGRLKLVTQWWSDGSPGASCHMSKCLQLQILLSVGPNTCPAIKPQVCMHPSATAPPDGSRISMQGPHGVVDLSSKLRSVVK